MTPKIAHLAVLATTMLYLLCTRTSAQHPLRPASAVSTLDALEKELEQLYAQMIARYDRATPKEREGLPDVNLGPRAQIMPKIAAAAERFAGTPDAVPFHLWILRDSRRLADQALAVASIDRLLAEHIEDERLESLAGWLPRYTRSLGAKEVLTRLDRLHKRNAKLDVQAACMLARTSVAPGSQDDLKRLLRRILAFAPRTASGRRAKERLFEIEHLQVGCTAPDIVGIDLEGVEFRLSDYKGKVVFLDFWGDW